MSDGTVYERVHAVLAKLPAIGKNSRAPQNMGGYAFRGIEDITAALKPLLAEHGVFMVPTVKERFTSERTTRGGGTMYVVDLLVSFAFYAPDGSTFAAEMWGQGTDSGDKATQKAVTSAFKSMLSVTFCIADSHDDAEAHDVPDTTAEHTPISLVRDVADRLERIVNERAAHPDEWKAAKLPSLRELRAVLTGEMYLPLDLYERSIAVLADIDTRTGSGGEVQSSLPTAASDHGSDGPVTLPSMSSSPSPPPSSGGSETDGGSAVPDPPELATPAQVERMQARLAAVQADGFTVATQRKERKLPLVKPGITREVLDGWDAIVTPLEDQARAKHEPARLPTGEN